MSRRSRVRHPPGVHQPQWRNRIARRTSNPEVVGSSPTWGIAGGKISHGAAKAARGSMSGWGLADGGLVYLLYGGRV